MKILDPSINLIWWWWWWWWIVLLYGWPTKGAEPYFQPGSLSEILTIANLRHAASRIWICAEPEFRLSWIKLCSSDNHYTTAPLLDQERRATHVFQWYFGLSNCLRLFLLLLEAGNKFIPFCYIFCMKWVSFLASSCVGLLLDSTCTFSKFKKRVRWLRVNVPCKLQLVINSASSIASLNPVSLTMSPITCKIQNTVGEYAYLLKFVQSNNFRNVCSEYWATWIWSQPYSCILCIRCLAMLSRHIPRTHTITTLLNANSPWNL